MKKLVKTLTFCTLTILSSISFADTAAKPVTIGIVVPIEIPAMKQIVQGFETTLTQQSKTPVKFMVKNAQGDPNIERSIMQQFNGPSVDIVAPIGTDASQMAIAMIQNKPIIGIAADQLKQNAKKANNPNVTGVLDEVSVAKQIAFIHQAMPQIKKLTLVYSSDDRIFADVKTAVTTAKKYNIKIQKLMMSQL